MLVGMRGVEIRNFEELLRLAKGVFESGLAPRSFKSVQQVVVAMMTGMELGFGPMASLRTIAPVNGGAQVWGDASLALARRSAHFDTIEEWYEVEGKRLERPIAAPTSATYTAVCRVTLRDGQQTERSFSIGEAQKAGLMEKDTYRTYLNRMLLRRARGYALRDAVPEQFFNLPISDLDPNEAQTLSDEANILNRRIEETEALGGQAKE